VGFHFSDLLRARNTAGSQEHLLCTMAGPDLSYSALEIHIDWKVGSDAMLEPPIQAEYLRSGGAMTLIFIFDIERRPSSLAAGASAVSSLVSRSAMPGHMVVPPDSTMFA
jgi:hypothetical protein